MATVDLKDAVFTIKDGTGTAKTCTVVVGDGNIQFDESVNYQYLLDRGILDEVRLGDQVPVNVSFAFRWKYVVPATGHSGGEVVTPQDALRKRGAASTWVSSDKDTCKPYAVDLSVVLTAPCAGRTKTITLADFRCEKLSYDIKAGSISASGKCNITAPTIVNV